MNDFVFFYKLFSSLSSSSLERKEADDGTVPHMSVDERLSRHLPLYLYTYSTSRRCWGRCISFKKKNEERGYCLCVSVLRKSDRTVNFTWSGANANQLCWDFLKKKIFLRKNLNVGLSLGRIKQMLGSHIKKII